MNLVLVAMIFSSASSFRAKGGEDRQDAHDAIRNLSGENMMLTIQDLQDFYSRAFYLNSSKEAASYIYNRFEEMGISVEYQDFVTGTHNVENVVATVQGTVDESPPFLFGAHYDSENQGAVTLVEGQKLAAPGADDDASGVASVIELARVVSNLRLPNTVKFVAFGAEEYGYDSSGGLAGSRSFVDSEKANGTSYEACWILDMIGYKDESENHTVMIVNGDSVRLGASMHDAVNALGIDLSIDIENNSLFLSSDHASFWTAGYPAALLIESDPMGGTHPFNPYYHSANDTVDMLSEQQILAVTQGLVASLMDMSTPGHARTKGAILVMIAVPLAAVTAVLVSIYFARLKVREG